MNWDYIAGFFDGEGNINILKRQGRRLRARIAIVQRIDNSGILQQIQEFLSAQNIQSHIYQRKPYKNRLPVAALQVDDQLSVSKFLFQIEKKILKDRPKFKDAFMISKGFKPYRTKLTLEELQEAKELRDQGSTFKEIGKILGRDKSNLSKIFK